MAKKVFILFISLIAFNSFSQETGSIKGNITDAEMLNEPLMFAHVSLKGTDRTVQTNLHGNYELEGLDPGEYTLIVQFLGYETMEIPVAVEKSRVSRINRCLEAKKVDITAILSSETTTSSTHLTELSASRTDK